MDIIATIFQDIYPGDLYPGATINSLTCPKCEGGRGKERSFSLTCKEDGVLLFKCFRATCGFCGRADGTNYTNINTNGSSLKPEFIPRICPKTCYLTTEHRNIIYEIYRLSCFAFGFIYSFDPATGLADSRFAVRIAGPNGTTRGWEARRLPGRTIEPKTLHYREVNEPWQGWFFHKDKTRPTVIVEDVLSAMRVSESYTAVSIMGTNLTTDKVLEIAQYSYKDRIILALDKDAWSKSIDYANKFRFLMPGIKLLPLEQDLKYESPENINRLIGGFYE